MQEVDPDTQRQKGETEQTERKRSLKRMQNGGRESGEQEGERVKKRKDTQERRMQDRPVVSARLHRKVCEW
jgi:hypothetical protein